MFFFFEAFVLGLIFNAVPGVVFAETIKRGVSSGFWGALYVQIGSLIGDATWAILGLIGIGILLNIEVVKIPLSFLAALYLLYLAYDSFLLSNKKIVIQTGNKTYNNALKSGVILSLTNPQNIAYWAALGSAFSALGISEPIWLDYCIFFSGFMSSSIIWCFVCAFAVDKLYLKSNNLWKKLTYRLCTIVFIYLALALIIENSYKLISRGI